MLLGDEGVGNIDNAGCVDLIGSPPNGILNLLDHVSFEAVCPAAVEMLQEVIRGERVDKTDRERYDVMKSFEHDLSGCPEVLKVDLESLRPRCTSGRLRLVVPSKVSWGYKVFKSPYKQ